MIPVHQPPEAEGPEPCALCGRPTGFWTALPDRQPKDQVACCGRCSEAREPKDVPSKEEWFRKALPRATYKVNWRVTF